MTPTTCDVYLVNESYEITELRDGTVILRNLTTGAEVEGRIVVNLSDGALRVEQVHGGGPTVGKGPRR